MPVEYTLRQYTNKKLHLIILLPFNQKNKTITILFLSINKYNGNKIIS